VALYALGAENDSPVENPSMVKANNTYYLFYSTGSWVTANYRTRYVTCNGPNGPCSAAATTVQSTFGPLSGPGGLYPFVDRYGAQYVVFHSWLDESTDYNPIGAGACDWNCNSYPCRKAKRNAFVFPLMLPSGGTPFVRYY
jgi:hypothetical protein